MDYNKNTYVSGVCGGTRYLGKTGSVTLRSPDYPGHYRDNVDCVWSIRGPPGHYLTFTNIRKIETERGETKVVIYFETITKREKCLTVEAFRTHRVANQKPAPVVVYDYYDQSRRARSFYDVVPATLCDICEGRIK